MSIPTSLIVVVLVLAWLVVLVPMVARRREAVPEAEMAGGTFRVLQRSGGTARRRPGFRRRPDSEADDTAEDRAGQDVSSDQELDEELLDDEYDDTDDYHGADTDEHSDYRNVNDEFAGQQVDPRAVAEGAAPIARASVHDSGRRRTGSHPYHRVEHGSSGSHPYRPAAPSQVDPLASRPEPVRYEAESASYDDEAAAYASSSGPLPTPHVDDMHLRPIPRRPGRGGYDPDAAELARQFKYSRRRRVAVVLLLVTLLFSAAAVLISPVLWVGAAVVGLLLIGYFVYLRRQVRIEASIRERRLARLRRARQIRPEYDVDRSDSPAAGSPFAAGPRISSQAPASGYRRGRQIVDLDDDDPSFDDLEYYEPLLYRRASGQ